mmetsp:Transcript_56475/g.132465  ORF Transcript_56475/g.132465 Transcript_56475/m.132465 type:complete len:244 (+) Transcript_56475:143-874(+)
MSGNTIPNSGKLAMVSIFCMLLVAMVVMTDIPLELGFEEHTAALIIPAHILAQFVAWKRIRTAMRRAEERLDLWSGATASASVLVDWVQFAALVHRLKRNDARWIEAACMLSLVSIFFEDFIGMVLVSLPPAGKAEAEKPARIHLESFALKRADLEAGKTGFAECPCHICLEELQDGESVAKLLCGHIFHEKCIEDWLQIGTGCALRCQAALGLNEVDAVEEPIKAVEEPRVRTIPVEAVLEV